MRQTTRLAKTARFIRLSASGGDGLYAVGELAVYSECPAHAPELSLRRVTGAPLADDARGKMWLFGAAALLFVLLHRKDAQRRRDWLMLLPLGTGVMLVLALLEIYPFFKEESLLRAVEEDRLL
jgi:hypothetical protein